MKLYTEEQVRKAINDGSLYSYINGDFEFKNSEDDIINSLTPIELPSDEEIEEASRRINYGGGSMGWIKDAFKQGAKWMQEQLKK